MSDLAAFVAAHLRDRTVVELQQELERKDALLRAKNTVQVVSTSTNNNNNIVYASTSLENGSLCNNAWVMNFATTTSTTTSVSSCSSSVSATSSNTKPCRLSELEHLAVRIGGITVSFDGMPACGPWPAGGIFLVLGEYVLVGTLYRVPHSVWAEYVAAVQDQRAMFGRTNCFGWWNDKIESGAVDKDATFFLQHIHVPYEIVRRSLNLEQHDEKEEEEEEEEGDDTPNTTAVETTPVTPPVTPTATIEQENEETEAATSS